MNRKPNKERVGTRTQEHALAAASSSLREIRALAEAYDVGDYLTARTIAAVIYRLLLDELKGASLFDGLELKSFSADVNFENLLDEMPLTGVMWGAVGDKEHVRFTDIKQQGKSDFRLLSANRWLDEVVYMEGRASHQCRLSSPPTNKFSANPGRLSLTRRILLSRSRNELGAHFDMNMTAEWAFATTWNSAIVIGVDLEDGSNINILDNPEHFVIVNTLGDAMVRSIAHEVLESIEPAPLVAWPF